MTEDREPASAEHLKASVKEALGKITGNVRIEAEGRREKRRAAAEKATGVKSGDPFLD